MTLTIDGRAIKTLISNSQEEVQNEFINRQRNLNGSHITQKLIDVNFRDEFLNLQAVSSADLDFLRERNGEAVGCSLTGIGEHNFLNVYNLELNTNTQKSFNDTQNISIGLRYVSGLPEIDVQPSLGVSGASTLDNNGELDIDFTLDNFTVDWASGDPIDFRPVLATVDRNMSLPSGEYEITDTDAITFNYWIKNNSITANDGYIFGSDILGGQCGPRHSGSLLRVSRHDFELIGVFTNPTLTATTTPYMLTFTYNPTTRLYRAYKNGVELFVPGSGSLGSAGELDGNGRLRLVAGKSFATGNLKIGNNSANSESFNGKLYEGFIAKKYVASPEAVMDIFNKSKSKYGL